LSLRNFEEIEGKEEWITIDNVLMQKLMGFIRSSFLSALLLFNNLEDEDSYESSSEDDDDD
jgi:hypothetical protein